MEVASCLPQLATQLMFITHIHNAVGGSKGDRAKEEMESPP